MNRKYTVILLYPEYTDAGSWPESYVAWVEGESQEDAIAEARMEAKDNYEAEYEGEINDPTDFEVIGVVEGHHKVYGE